MISVTVGIGWNVLIAHFREAVEKSPGVSFLDSTLLTTPAKWFALSTVEAWALLLLGVLIFGLAATKGRGGRSCFVDPYPGYRAVDRTYREAQSHYADGQDEYKNAISNAYGKAWTTFNDRYPSAEGRLAA